MSYNNNLKLSIFKPIGEVILPEVCMTFINDSLLNDAFSSKDWTNDISGFRCIEVLPKIKKAILDLVYTKTSYNYTRELKLLGKLEIVCIENENFIIEIS